MVKKSETVAKPKKVVTKKVVKKVVPKTKVEAPAPVVETPVVETPATPNRKKVVKMTPEELQVKFNEMIESLEKEQTFFKENKTVSKTFFTSQLKELKSLKNEVRKTTKAKSLNKRPSNVNSGFSKPIPISDDLCSFGGWEKGSLKSRTDVTRLLCRYIKENDLQSHPDSKSIIVPDNKLKKLLKPEKLKQEPLQFKTMQKLIQAHFI